MLALQECKTLRALLLMPSCTCTEKNRTTSPVMASPNKALIQSLHKIANISPANTFGMHIFGMKS